VPLVQCCQQAGLIAYLDDGNYVKWDVIADDGAGQARLELRSEIDDVVQEPQADVWVDYPADDTYWLRLAKSGATYSAAYSLDGESWTDFGTEVTNAAIGDGAAIGLFTLGAFQDAPLWAGFDHFTLDAEPEPGQPDLRLSVTPHTRAVKLGRLARFTATVRNTGGARATRVRVCANGSRSKVRVVGEACRTKNGLAPGARMAPSFKLKPKPSARGKRVTIRFMARAAGVKTLKDQATLRVKRR
jgi:hypothetical protein